MTSAGSWFYEARAGLAQIPDESTLSAAARRVFHRAEPGNGGIGPGPALAPPPFEGAPVWAAFPELMATGPRAASATFWWSSRMSITAKRMCVTDASVDLQDDLGGTAGQSSSVDAHSAICWTPGVSWHEASSGRHVVRFDSNPSPIASHSVMELLACSIACAGR